MNFFLTGLKYGFTRRLRSVKTWVILLLLPILILTVNVALPSESVAAPVQVGVALPTSGGEELMELLQQRSGTVMTFLEADPDTIDRNVASGKWDCGLILPEDFDQRVENLDTYRLITLRIGAGSVVYPLVQETVASCMCMLSSGQIAESYLLSSGIVTDKAGIPADLRSANLSDGIKQVQIHMRTPDGTQMDAVSVTESGMQDLLLWGIGIFMLVWMLMRGADLGALYESGAIRRMRTVRSATAILSGTVGADLVSIWIAAMVAMAVMGADLGGYWAVCVYGLFLGAMCLVVARFPAVWKSIPLAPPFVVLISLLLTGTLVDMTVLFPGIAPVLQWMPGRMFLDVCHGDYAASLPLIGASGILIVLSLILDGTRK